MTLAAAILGAAFAFLLGLYLGVSRPCQEGAGAWREGEAVAFV